MTPNDRINKLCMLVNAAYKARDLHRAECPNRGCLECQEWEDKIALRRFTLVLAEAWEKLQAQDDRIS